MQITDPVSDVEHHKIFGLRLRLEAQVFDLGLGLASRGLDFGLGLDLQGLAYLSPCISWPC